MEDKTKNMGVILKRSLLFSRLRWSFVYLAWIHIFMVVAMLKFASVGHRSTLYVWYLCPILSPLSMDIRCILVAMLVYSSHGSALYWSTTMSWLLVSMSQNIDVLQMPTWKYAPIELTFSSHGDDLFSQRSRLLYPSKTHALGGILLYQNPITIMW